MNGSNVKELVTAGRNAANVLYGMGEDQTLTDAQYQRLKDAYQPVFEAIRKVEESGILDSLPPDLLEAAEETYEYLCSMGLPPEAGLATKRDALGAAMSK